MALAATVLLAGCFEIEGDLEDPYIKAADMAQPLREGFYEICSISKRGAPDCTLSEVVTNGGAFELFQAKPDPASDEYAEWMAERDAMLRSQPGTYVAKRLVLSPEKLSDLGPVEAELASAPIFLVGKRDFSEGEVTRIRYGLAKYNVDERYWEMWEPKCDNIGVRALATWVRNDWLIAPDKKVSEWGNETCVFKREGLNDDLLRFILSFSESFTVQRLYWRGETDPDLRIEPVEEAQ
jgi:hypothetical protein